MEGVQGWGSLSAIEERLIDDASSVRLCCLLWTSTGYRCALFASAMIFWYV